MERRRGFTIIELVVTITVMTILMVLVTIRLVFTEQAGRDQKRAIDTVAIAKGLELYYQNGVSDLSIPRGYYPGSTQVQTAKTTSPPFLNFLEGVSKASFEAPDKTGISFSTDTSGVPVVGANTDGSYNDTQLNALLTNIPYLYQPLKRDNTLCSTYTDCVKFNLYYQTESDKVNHKITSRNQ